MTEPASDDELVLRVRSGDAGAFEALVERYRERLYRYAYRMTGRHAVADDLVQETFVRAHRALDGYEVGTSFKAWVFQILTNLGRDHHRKRGRRPDRVPIRDDDRQAPPAYDGVARAEARELGEAVSEALADLPHEQREAFVLRCLEGLEYDEISEVTGVKAGTVRWRVYRARDRLKDLLASWLKASEASDPDGEERP